MKVRKRRKREKAFHVLLDDEEHAILMQLAEKNSMTAAMVVRMLIRGKVKIER